jgi:hypothetical protein
MSKVYEVEVKTSHEDPNTGNRVYGWLKLPASKARLRTDDRKRCIECHAPVKVMTAGPNGVPAAHAEHFKRFAGCSLSDEFDGTKRPNPDAVD